MSRPEAFVPSIPFFRTPFRQSVVRQKETWTTGVLLLTGFFYFLQPNSHLVLLLLGAVLLGAAFTAPVGSLMLLAFVLPFEQAREVAPWGTVFTGEYALFVCLPGWLWNVGAQRAWQKVRSPVALWSLPFVLALLLSLSQTGNPIALKGTLRWCEFLLVLIFAVHLLRRHGDGEKVLLSLLAAAVLSSIHGIIQSTSGQFMPPVIQTITTSHGEIVRAAAQFGANTLAVFLAMLLPFSCVMSLLHPRRVARLAGIGACSLLFTGLLLTFSITGIIVLVPVLAGLMIYLCRRSLRIVLWLITLSAVLLSLVKLFNPTVFTLGFLQTKLASFHDRLDYLFVVGRMLRHSPWFGAGPGMYRFEAPGWALGNINPIGLITYPHSLWLTVLAELGLTGLAMLLLGGVSVARFLTAKLRRTQPGWHRIAGWTLTLSFAGFVLANTTEHCLIHDRGMHMALMLGATLVFIGRRPSRPRTEGMVCFNRQWIGHRPASSDDITRHVEGRKTLHALIAAALDGQKKPVVLEAGCGPALDALCLAANRLWEVHALDRSAQAITLAAGNAKQLHRKLQTCCADIRCTRLADGRFDLIFSQGLLEHFPDPGQVWREMTRLVKPGGKLIIDVPQTMHPYTVIKKIHQWKGTWPWGWETQYTLGDLREQGRRYGWKVSLAKGYGYRGGRFDITDQVRRLVQPRFPKLWKTLEDRFGAYWMMNIAVLFERVD